MYREYLDKGHKADYWPAGLARHHRMLADTQDPVDRVPDLQILPPGIQAMADGPTTDARWKYVHDG